MSIKIAMIGAGSIGFTRRLMHDILAVPELADTTFALMDISQANLDMVKQLCERDIKANNLPAQIVSPTHWSMPYLSGMSMSSWKASRPPWRIMQMT